MISVMKQIHLLGTLEQRHEEAVPSARNEFRRGSPVVPGAGVRACLSLSLVFSGPASQRFRRQVS